MSSQGNDPNINANANANSNLNNSDTPATSPPVTTPVNPPAPTSPPVTPPAPSTPTTNTNNSNNSNPSNITNNDDFVTLTLDQTITEPGLVITNQQGVTENGNEKTQSTFNTTDNENNAAHITENLLETVVAGYDDTSVTGQIVAQISTYASKIKCEDFHGKGSIDDYNKLFEAAAKIANESKQMQLDIDVDGFADFGRAADDLSALFTSFTRKLQNVNIIDDSVFLNAVLSALIKVSNLSDVFGRFKETILMTSTVNIPKSAHDTKLILEGVMGEISCAMGYINNFVNADSSLPLGQLSAVDKNIINQAVNTIDNWNVLCDQGVSIALSSNPDIQYIKQANLNLKQKTNLLNTATSSLRAKFALIQ